MLKRTLLTLGLLCAPLAGVSPQPLCAAEPLTLTTPEQENELGEKTYKEILSKEKVCKDPATVAFVENVARRICAAAPDKGFKYEISVLESDTVNAFCLPGGKICVYTAILPYCQNEAGLATVLGHEVAHAILRHGGQRMTQGAVVDTVGGLFSKLLQSRGYTNTTQTVAMGAYQYGTQLGILLPYSRGHETEADENGLKYMAAAGYHPQQASEFWGRFSKLSTGTPQFLSTHPDSGERQKHLAELIPTVLPLYEKSQKIGTGANIPKIGSPVQATQPVVVQQQPAPATTTTSTATTGTQTSGPVTTGSTTTTSTTKPNLGNITLSDLGLISQEEIGAAVKEALSGGFKNAIAILGKQDGYFKDELVKIAMPEDLKKIDEMVRLVGKGKIADEFVENINHAAEKAAPDAAGILAGSLANLSLNDARALMKGAPDAATAFFKKSCQTQLEEKFLPIVKDATAKAGATSSYKNLMKKAGFAAQLLVSNNFDLDKYVTNKAVDGLFVKMAEEEKKIRANPQGQASDLIRKVFGAKQ